MNIDFIQKFIIEQIEGYKPAEIKTLVYRDGGVEIAPGNIVECIIPEWLKDETIEIELEGTTGTIKSNYGDVDIQVEEEPKIHSVSTDHEADDHVLTQIEDIDPKHKLTITFKNRLKDGDSVVVARYSGLAKYVILCKAEVTNA